MKRSNSKKNSKGKKNKNYADKLRVEGEKTKEKIERRKKGQYKANQK